MASSDGGEDRQTAIERLRVYRIETAYEQLAEQLRNQIVQGTLAPGERLPNEADLAAVFGVSRTTLREALRVLSSQHLITVRRCVTGGTFVAHPRPDNISQYLEASVGLLSGTNVPERHQCDRDAARRARNARGPRRPTYRDSSLGC
jgi:DNA-binding transcriptional regulator YhcF (GntR family)